MQPTSIGVEATSHFSGASVRKSASTTRLPSRELLEFLSRSRPRLTRSTRNIFERHIMPLLNGAGVEFIGEINEHAKAKFLGGALASALSDRLAGALRTCADRSDGLWNAGARIQARLRAGDRR